MAAESFAPQPRAKAINLRLVMENSLTKGELAAYNAMDAEKALDRAQGLRTVHLEWQNIAEIANLDVFEILEVLYMQSNRIERIENLESLPKLQFLALQSNSIKVMENLLCLKHLEFLDLSKNQIEELDEAQLPVKINILRLQDNPCTLVRDYRSRVQARLPELIHLDGASLTVEEEEVGSNVPASHGADAEPEPEELLAGEKGLGAYYRKGEMQTSIQNAIRDKIEAYSQEMLLDADGFSRQVEEATARSQARRDGRRPGTATRASALSSGPA